MSQFNEKDTETIRSGVMGAIALVSQAEPGFLATFKESMAAAKALQGAPEDFRSVMTGGLVMPPQAGNKDEMATRLLENLRSAVQVADQDPATGQAMRDYVLAACQQVAEAAKGVSPEESDAIEQVRQALQPSAAQPSQQPADDGSGQRQADGSAATVGQSPVIVDQSSPLAGSQLPNQAPGADVSGGETGGAPFQRHV